MKSSEPEEKANLSYIDYYKTSRAKQRTPDGDWNVWLILAGRGWGKTRTGAYDIINYAMRYPKTISAVIAPTTGDLRRVCFEGVSGINQLIPDACMKQGGIKSYNRSLSEITLWNDSKIVGFSAEQPDRLRGSQYHRAWCDELASWRYPDAFDQLMFGLRLGDKPRVVVTTTPRPTKLVKDLIKRNAKDVFITRGSTFENEDNLAESALNQYREMYEGTRLGRQELYAEVLEDVEGALWNHRMFESQRIKKEELPEFKRIVIAVDPAVTHGESSDETGIIVVGKGIDERFYVLEDASMKASPDKWMRTAIDLFYTYKADRIVAEVNNGGDLVEKLLRTIDRNIAYKKVQASRGKLVRAEPVVALYEQQKVSHVGSLSSLEDQLCTYAGGNNSPDRLDALVWGISELMTGSGNVFWRVN
jgi:predicted phage terminase large subunit-like protein